MDGLKHRTADAAPETGSPAVHLVGWGFIALYTAAFMSSILLLIAPLLVTLALKIDSLVGIDRAPGKLALVAGVGSLLAMFANPLAGRLSDRTSSRFGMRRPWIVIGLLGGSTGTLLVALAPNIPVVLVGWCIAQIFFNALMAAMVAALPDQVPAAQRGVVSGALGVCLPVASVCGTFIVKLFTGSLLAMFMAPCVLGGIILLFAARIDDRRLPRADKPGWSLGELARTFYVKPGTSRDFLWAFASRFMFVLAYAFVTTYQAFYLLDRLGSAKAEVPGQIFLGILVQSAVVVAASLLGGKASDLTGRRKVFVFAASIVYGGAMFVFALASNVNGFLVGMAIAGLGLGVFNIASALPYSIAPAMGAGILAIGSYGGLFAVAGTCALLGAVAIQFVKRVR